MRFNKFVFIILIFFIFLKLKLIKAEIIDKIIAVIEDEAICNSELNIYIDLKSLISKDFIKVNKINALNNLIKRKVIVYEILKFNLVKLDNIKFNKWFNKVMGKELKGKIENIALKYELSKEELRAWFKEEFLIQEFVNKYFSSALVVSNDEIKNYIIENFGENKLEIVLKDENLVQKVKLLLKNKKVNKSLEDWYQLHSKNYKIEIFLKGKDER